MSAVRETICIQGNPWDSLGNPVPFVRTTQRGKFHVREKGTGKLTGYGRYLRYCDYVVESVEPSVLETFQERIYPDLATKLVKYLVDVRISFKGKHHADADNVIKGILDALFGRRRGTDDKFIVARLVDWIDCQDDGHVELVVHGPYPRSVWANIPNQA